MCHSHVGHSPLSVCCMQEVVALVGDCLLFNPAERPKAGQVCERLASACAAGHSSSYVSRALKWREAQVPPARIAGTDGRAPLCTCADSLSGVCAQCGVCTYLPTLLPLWHLTMFCNSPRADSAPQTCRSRTVNVTNLAWAAGTTDTTPTDPTPRLLLSHACYVCGAGASTPAAAREPHAGALYDSNLQMLPGLVACAAGSQPWQAAQSAEPPNPFDDALMPGTVL